MSAKIGYLAARMSPERFPTEVGRPSWPAGCWPLFRAAILVAVLFAGGLEAVSSAEPVSAPGLVGDFNEVENPTITGEVDPPATLSIGRAEIRPEPGSRLFLLSVHGRDAGYLLEGHAELVYRVEEPFSVPAARHNLKRADGITVRMVEGTLIASTRLAGAAVWGRDIDLGDRPARPAAGRQLPQWLRSILDKKFLANPARDFLCADRNGEPSYRWAIFHGAGEELVLDVDPRPSAQSEHLFRLLKPRSASLGPLSGRRFPETLAAQPIGRSWWDAEAIEFASVDTEIQVKNDKGDHVQVTTRTRLRSLRDGLLLLPMRHLDGAFGSGGRWQELRTIRLVVDGQPAPYVHRDGQLLVALPRRSQRGDSFLLEVVAEGDILERPSGDSYWRLGGEAWYPKPGVGGLEWAEIRITAEVRSPFLPFAGGEILESGSSGGVNRVRTRLKAPMRTAMVIAGKYRTVTEEQDGTRIHISSYASVKKVAARRVAQVVLSVKGCLETWLGVPYPFQDLQVIEIKQWGWGQAPPGLIFITQEAFLTQAVAQTTLLTESGAASFSRGINERVAHEVAHAWFPHVSKVVRSEESWLSESLAEYASAVCLELSMANQRGKRLFERQLREWKNRSKDAGGSTSVYLANLLASTGADGRRIRRDLLYGRGPLVLHAIRHRLKRQHGEKEGDRLFLTWIRSYVKNFTFKAGETRYLIGILNQITGDDWQPFFERHIYGVEAPRMDDD